MHQYTLTCSLKSALGLIVAFQSHLCPSSFHQQLGPPWSCWTFGCWQTVALPRHCPLLCGDLETGQLFLDTQVSLAPTHVSWLVGWSVTLSDFQSLVALPLPPSLRRSPPSQEVATITKEVATITKEVDTITKEVDTITKEVFDQI